MTAPLADLAGLTAALRASQEARLRALTQEEAELRSRIAALDDSRRAAASLPASDLSALRGLGADLLWQAWLARARQDLQMRLARVLARRALALRDLRQAHGRAEAARALADGARAVERAATQRRRQAAVQDLHLLTLGEAER